MGDRLGKWRLFWLRTKSNQRWMKLRTTVQLSGAITSTIQKSKTNLKREDSFLKRFSTRQIPDQQETIDTGDDTDASNGNNQDQDEVNRRRIRRRRQSSRFVVNPDENFYFYWLMVVTICVLYNLWAQIVRQSFPELQKLLSTYWFTFDAMTDVVFVLDIVVQFRTGYLEQGLMVYDWKKLAGHYMKSRAFTLDILSLIPLDLLQLMVGINPILRFTRFLKTYRVYDYYYMVESRTVYPNLWRVVNLVHILLILAHWFGCFYYLLSEAEDFKGDWVYPYQAGDYATLTRKYLGSLYWSTLTLTTIGDLPTPETNSENPHRTRSTPESRAANKGQRRKGHKSRLLHCKTNARNGGNTPQVMSFSDEKQYIFTIVSYLIGVFIFATIVGQVGNVITNRNANRLEFERLLDGAKTYMRHHKVPSGMKRRVLRWYDYSWSRGRIQGGGDINTALGLLPDKLKTELALHVNLSVLKKVTIFQECQPEFLHDLVLKMKAYIFTPGDLICRKGEVAREMFIIADGILDVISDTGRVLTTMKAGDFFGEIGILNLDGLNKRTADVRSVGYSELFSLSREDVLAAMNDYPEAEEILQTLGRKRLMEARNASKMHKQGKDQSSVESDTTGKRIVEKLRSDVKGLKNVLRRSKRSARSKDKQSTLQRMSHVQSSDEYDTEPPQSPIGAGLPLLQRLKLLKEKQDREKVAVQGQTDEKKEATTENEVIGAGLPLMQRLKLLKQKETTEEGKVEEVNKIEATVVATVHTQHVGVRFDKPKATDPSATSEVDTSDALSTTSKTSVSTLKKKDGGRLFRDALKMLHQKPGHDESAAKKTEIVAVEPTPGTSQSDKLEVSELVAENKTDGTKGKESWHLLRKSSVRQPKSRKTAYLSKSDTILERRSEEEDVKERRSRSASPSTKGGRRSLRGAVEFMIKERRRTKSFTHSSKRTFEKDESSDVNAWEFQDTAFCHTEPTMVEESTIKKYDSVSDLSPEYSDLPFVKKLKILNERQQAVFEENVTVRSASLDVPERASDDEAGLIRSQSEASAIRIQNRTQQTTNIQELNQQRPSDFAERNEMAIDRPLNLQLTAEDDLMHSPESNETIERRNLKSILKRLSAEDHEEDSAKKVNDEEMKRLLRAPTIEGYAARHSKLTKSVTFNRQTLQSPPAPPHTTEMATLPESAPIQEKTPYVIQEPEKSAASKIRQQRKSQDDEVFRGVIVGIKQVMQGYVNEMEMRFQCKFQNLQMEVRRRDDMIVHLQSKLQEYQKSPEDDEKTAEDVFMRDGSFDTVLEESSLHNDSSSDNDDINEDDEKNVDDYDDSVTSSPLRVVDDVSDLFKPSNMLSRPSLGSLRGAIRRRASDVEQYEMHNMPRCYRTPSMDIRRVKSEDEARKREYITVEMEVDEGDEEFRNENWEAEMLAEELEKRDTNNAQRSLDEVRTEVKKLQKVVKGTDLRRLSANDLQVLEKIVEASDRKIRSLSQSCEPSTSDYTWSRKTFKRKLGQTLSFDLAGVRKEVRKQEETTFDSLLCQSTRGSMPSLSAVSISSLHGLDVSVESDNNDIVFEDDEFLLEATESLASAHENSVHEAMNYLASVVEPLNEENAEATDDDNASVYDECDL